MKIHSALLLVIALSVSAVSAAPIPHSANVETDATDFNDGTDVTGTGSRFLARSSHPSHLIHLDYGAGGRLSVRSEELPVLADSIGGQVGRLKAVRSATPKKAHSGSKSHATQLFSATGGRLSVRSEELPTSADSVGGQVGRLMAVRSATPKKAHSGSKSHATQLFSATGGRLSVRSEELPTSADSVDVSPKLADAWKKASSGSNVRAVKISIINESLEDDGIFDIKGNFEQDFSIVHENLEEKQPAYFLVRFDGSKSAEWIFLCYVPDVAPIRQKMIYAATRASLTKDLGDSHFTDSIYGTNKGDFTLEGYKRHRASLAAPKPLSERERQLAEIRANEKTMVENMTGGAYRKSHAPGMNFPLTERAVAALKKLAVVATPAIVKPSALPKKITSPTSTPLPASPGISRENTIASADETKKTTLEENVDDDEWDDDETKEAKKAAAEEETPAEAEADKEEEEEVAEPVEETPVPAAKPERTINFVKLAIDAQNERIDLASEEKITANELVKNIDEELPRFTFFAYEHKHNGTAHDSLVFMYTCPSKSKIRERMLYSSCRAGVLQAAKDDAGLNVDKKLETTDVSDLTEAFVLEELHPKTHSSFGGGSGGSGGSGGARGFSKPARPGARKVM
ncbi:Twinfilin-1 [Dissophora ornata]|nr:Twinfilin-1 [Dissophora ornata]